MGVLSEEQRQEMALVWGKIFEAVCDECRHLIPMGSTYTVVKYKRQKWEGPTGERPYGWQARIPKRIRCNKCDDELHRDIREKYSKKKKVKLGKKSRKKVTPEEAAKINPTVKKIAVSILKKSVNPIDTLTLKQKLLVKVRKKDSRIKKSEINASLRFLKKAKVLVCKKKLWSLATDI